MVKMIKNIIGIFLIFLGLFCNEWVLEKFISTYALVTLNNKVPIILLEFLLIILGLFLLMNNIDRKTISKLFEYYKRTAVILLSLFLLIAFIGSFLLLFSTGRNIISCKDQIFIRNGSLNNELYLGLNKKQIKKLLTETWSRPFAYEPYTQFKEKPFHGKYVNVDENGFRLTKNQGPWPPSKDNLNIFLFGGSITFNYGVTDDQTIASYLQELYAGKPNSKKIFIYNFGRGHYFSSQERILFEKLITSGIKPDIAVFIDGLNDFYYFNDEPLFTGNLRKFMEDKGTNLLSLPLISAVKNIKKSFGEENIKQIGEKDGKNSKIENYNDPQLINKVINRYVVNKKIIELIGANYGVRTFFIWQPVPTYKYNLKHHIFAGKGFGRFITSKYGYAHMEEYVKNHDMGNDFLWLADIQESLEKPLYIDIDHYSPEMSGIIAKNIYNFLMSKNVQK